MNAKKKTRHMVCKPGAAVRLHGYMPARVLELCRLDDCGTVYAKCVVTVKRAGIGPHGYKPGEVVTVRVGEAVPRDCIRVARGSGGRLTWGPVEYRFTP